jgi:hypothetical protein
MGKSQFKINFMFILILVELLNHIGMYIVKILKPKVIYY